MISSGILCIAAAIYHESKGESVQGQLAVGSVVVNRSRQRSMDECAVVKQRGQFSWYRSNSQITKMNNPKYEKFIDLAIKSKSKDYSCGSTHFHSKSVRPNWSSYLTRTITIGNHVFYKESKSNTKTNKRGRK